MRSILRGIIVVESIAFGPYVVGGAVTKLAVATGGFTVANVAFGVVLFWSSLTLPHFWILPRPWPSAWDVTLAFLQWGTVGAIVGQLRGRRRLTSLALFGLAAVAAVSAVVHILIRVLGYGVFVEGP